jgi:hypothetical protein
MNFSSWVAFDKDKIDFETRSNKDSISLIDETDYQIVLTEFIGKF